MSPRGHAFEVATFSEAGAPLGVFAFEPDLEPAAESGLAMQGRVVMTARYCLKYERGLCPRAPGSGEPTATPEPWYLVDDEGRRLRLRFRCEARDCVMEVIYEG